MEGAVRILKNEERKLVPIKAKLCSVHPRFHSNSQCTLSLCSAPLHFHYVTLSEDM